MSVTFLISLSARLQMMIIFCKMLSNFFETNDMCDEVLKVLTFFMTFDLFNIYKSQDLS